MVKTSDVSGKAKPCPGGRKKTKVFSEMSNVVIKVENLAKQYRLGSIGQGYLRDDITKYLAKLRGKENPFLKVGDVNDRTAKGGSDYVWAIKDINFEVKQGQVLGIIGKNGAGKSTLLKILSKVTTPTVGQIKMKGRVASLLEVGTGFHPELTGRENIFLNSAILGMTKSEIKSKFDEIVDFSGVEKYIDTPVKRYSSGMYVRLAFGVAAFLESEIMIVDEVLAVGDAEFQKKCLGKMKDVSVNEGRTVLFVSHNIGAIKNLCTSGIILQNGRLTCDADIATAVENYVSNANVGIKLNYVNQRPQNALSIVEASINNSRPDSGFFDVNDKLRLSVSYEVKEASKRTSIAMFVKKDDQIVFMDFLKNNEGSEVLDQQTGRFTCSGFLPESLLKAGAYSIDFKVGIVRTPPIEEHDDALRFDIETGTVSNYSSPYSKDRPGFIVVDMNWNTL